MKLFVTFSSIIQVLLILISCNETKTKPLDSPGLIEEKDSVTIRKGIDVEPRLANTDSMQILFYDNPDGDTLRYSRFFKYAIVNDAISINKIVENLNQSYEEFSQAKNCRSEGKMYLFGGQRELKTIYFSSRCDSCCYLYFIKNGRFLYFPLSDAVAIKLDQWEKKSQSLK